MKCVRCGAVCTDTKICPHCGADLNKMRQDPSYLAESMIRSRQFMSLRSAVSMALTAFIACSVLALFTGQLRLSLPLILTAFGVIALSGSFNKGPEYKLSPAAGHLFTASVVVSSLSFALTAAVCIGVCIGGRETIDFLLSSYKELSGTDMVNEFLTLAADMGLNATADMFYMALYMVCVAGMFICGGGLLISGVEFIFLSSLKSSVASNKLELSLTGLFAAALLIKAIGFLAALLFAVSFTDMALFAASGYLYLCAYRCAKSVHELYK